MSDIPPDMTFIRIDRPGPPEVLVPDRMPVPAPADRRGADQGRGRRDQPAGRAAAPGRLSAAARCLRRARASRSRARSWRWATGVDALAGRRPGHGAGGSGGYAEYCIAPAPQVLPVPAGLSMVEAGADARDLLHRLDQRVRPRPAAGRRELPRPWRLVGHRHHRDPARACLRRHRVRHRRRRRTSSAPASSWAPSARSTTATRISSRSCARRPAAAAST